MGKDFKSHPIPSLPTIPGCSNLGSRGIFWEFSARPSQLGIFPKIFFPAAGNSHCSIHWHLWSRKSLRIIQVWILFLIQTNFSLEFLPWGQGKDGRSDQNSQNVPLKKANPTRTLCSRSQRIFPPCPKSWDFGNEIPQG